MKKTTIEENIPLKISNTSKRCFINNWRVREHNGAKIIHYIAIKSKIHFIMLAYLILAHADPGHLERLVRCLTHTDTDIYIHVDKKVNLQPFSKISKIRNVYFIEKRVKVYWGAYSVVEATINGLETIINAQKPYSYINLLSGQDYPIQSVEYIREFLQANKGKAFMEFYSVDKAWKEAIPRLRKYHLTNYHFPGRHLVQKCINVILPERKLPFSMVVVGHSQWFTITGDQVKYIVAFLHSNPKVRRYFQLTWGADELIFQTILYNSPHRASMVNNNLRYIDWSKGGVSPKTLIMEDAQLILASNKLFARKFGNDLNDPLLEFIDNKFTLKGKQKPNE